MPYQAKPLSLDPKSIKGISEKVLVSHYENNYVGAVKRLNAIGAQLAELDFAKAPNFMVNGLKREELIAANSMILHEIYFDGLGGGAGASGALAEAIARDFGSLERWRAEFVAMGKAEGGGSGWVILSYSPRDKRLVNQWAADHYHDPGRRPAGASARHVRARLSHGSIGGRPRAMSTSMHGDRADAQLAGGAARLRRSSVMSCRTSQILALTILLPATVCGSTAHADETFKLLGEKEIRARVVGKDITDSTHWVSYLRPDGVLLSDEMGRKWSGTWKIQNNKLCMSNPNLESPDCNEVWMSGANIRMRANKDQETFDAVVEKHRAN